MSDDLSARDVLERLIDIAIDFGRFQQQFDDLVRRQAIKEKMDATRTDG